MKLTISDVADRLGVSHRQADALVAAGEVLGRKLSSGAWLIDSDSVSRYELRRKPRGRPLDPASAWGTLFELSGESCDWLPARTHARVRNRIRQNTAETLANLVSSRARTHHFYADGAESILEDVVPSGRAAAHVLSTDLIEDRRRVCGYVPAGVDIDVFAEQHLMIADPSGPDILIENTSPKPLTKPLTAVVAADLAMSLDARERGAGIRALEELRQAWLAEHAK